MGNKGEDTDEMGVTSKEKNIFSQRMHFFSNKRIDKLLSKIMSFKCITQLSFWNKASV